MTELKHTEQALQKRLQREKFLSAITSRLLKTDDPQSIIEDLCLKTMEYLDCDVFFNYMASEQEGRMHLNACAGIPDHEAKKIEWLDYGVALCGFVAQERQRIVAENIGVTPDPRTDLVKSYGVKAYACHPLHVGERLIGTLSFGTRSRTTFTEEELSLMKTVADNIAIAMHRILANCLILQSEAKYRTLFESMTEGFVSGRMIYDQPGRACDYKFIEVNPAHERLTGISRDESTRKTILELIPTLEPQWIENHARVVETGEPLYWESYNAHTGKHYRIIPTVRHQDSSHPSSQI